MAHARQQIRERVQTLVNGLTTTGTNVFAGQVYNLQESQLPALLVYTTEEAIDELDIMASPCRLPRQLTLVVEGKAQVTTNIDDTLDDIAQEVETALGADDTLGLDIRFALPATTEKNYSDEGDQPIGSVVLSYLVEYATLNGAPSTIVN